MLRSKESFNTKLKRKRKWWSIENCKMSESLLIAQRSFFPLSICSLEFHELGIVNNWDHPSQHSWHFNSNILFSVWLKTELSFVHWLNKLIKANNDTWSCEFKDSSDIESAYLSSFIHSFHLFKKCVSHVSKENLIYRFREFFFLPYSILCKFSKF